MISLSPGKLGTLVEGAYGLGKSRLMRALLKSRGYTEYLEEAPLPQSGKVFCQITMTTKADQEASVKQLLHLAYTRGWVVILDEINVNPNASNFLNDVLTGKQNGKTLQKPAPGFYLLATQNSPEELGRYLLSPDLQNCLHKIEVGCYTQADWKEIITAALPGLLKGDTEYLIHRFTTDKLCPRKFFRILKQIAKDRQEQQKTSHKLHLQKIEENESTQEDLRIPYTFLQPSTPAPARTLRLPHSVD